MNHARIKKTRLAAALGLVITASLTNNVLAAPANGGMHGDISQPEGVDFHLVGGRAWYDDSGDAPAGAWGIKRSEFPGWTHNSMWGYFSGKAGDTITITAKAIGDPLEASAPASHHPGFTIYRYTDGRALTETEKDPKSSGPIVPDHFYPQYLDWQDGTNNFKNVGFAFDDNADGWSNNYAPGADGKQDGVVTASFILDETTDYLIAVGSVEAAGKQSINVSAQISSVPIPAAVWLFGAGLGGLIRLSRHDGHRT